MKRSSALLLGLAAGTARAAAAGPARRIVSLIPSITEDLFALGAGPQVLAVSQFTDFPPEARRLPQIASFASVNAEAVTALHPDLVVGIAAQAAAVQPLRREGLRIVLFDDDRFEDIFSILRRLGDLTGRPDSAAALERRLRGQTAELERRIDRARSPSVFVVLGVAPIYTVGARSFIATLIRMAGGRNVARLHSAYGTYSAEALLALDPAVILADPATGLHAALGTEPWRSLRAVRDGNLAYIAQPDVVLRPGPRYNDGLRWLIETFHRMR